MAAASWTSVLPCPSPFKDRSCFTVVALGQPLSPYCHLPAAHRTSSERRKSISSQLKLGYRNSHSLVRHARGHCPNMCIHTHPYSSNTPSPSCKCLRVENQEEKKSVGLRASTGFACPTLGSTKEGVGCTR